MSDVISECVTFLRTIRKRQKFSDYEQMIILERPHATAAFRGKVKK
jgi:hypothetical protein